VLVPAVLLEHRVHLAADGQVTTVVLALQPVALELQQPVVDRVTELLLMTLPGRLIQMDWLRGLVEPLVRGTLVVLGAPLVPVVVVVKVAMELRVPESMVLLVEQA
jgi:hypothetical protein